MKTIDKIEYGIKLVNGKIIDNNSKEWDETINNKYSLLTKKEILTKKCGICWDQVELERDFCQKEHISHKTYYIATYDDNNIPSHTFLVCEDNEKYYWVENSWRKFKGIHKYSSLKELLFDVKKKFLESNSYIKNNENTFIYEYKKPREHLTCQEFYDYIETQKIIYLEKL